MTVRRRFIEMLMAVHFALAPSTAPGWLLDLERRPVAMLAIGEPTPALAQARSRRNLR